MMLTLTCLLRRAQFCLTTPLEFQHHDAGEDARAAAMVLLRTEVELNEPFEQITSGNAAFQLSFPF